MDSRSDREAIDECDGARLRISERLREVDVPKGGRVKSWLLLGAAACVVPGGFVLLGAAWLRRRWLAKEVRAIDALIVPPVPIFGATTAQERESLRAGAIRRRDAADDKRRAAARIESGEPVEERLRLVK